MEQTNRVHETMIPKGITEINYKKLWGKHYICIKCKEGLLPIVLALDKEEFLKGKKLK